MKIRTQIGALLFLVLLMSGCIMSKFPGEVVELNVTMGQDIKALHRSYRALIVTHFESLRQQVDAFIKNRWMPTFIEDFTQRGNLKKLVENGRPDQVKEWTTVAMEAGVKKRIELITPIDEQEIKLLEIVDRSFALLSKSNDEITVFLKSHAKKASTLKAAMNIVDLKGLREQIDSGLADATSKTLEQTATEQPK